jgi:hypothetical protein
MTYIILLKEHPLESRFRLNPGEQPAIYTAFELCLHECQFERVQV